MGIGSGIDVINIRKKIKNKILKTIFFLHNNKKTFVNMIKMLSSFYLLLI